MTHENLSINDLPDLSDSLEYANGELMTLNELTEFTGVSRTKIYKIINSKFLEFPQPIGKIAKNKAYSSQEIMDWLDTHDITAALPSLKPRASPDPDKLPRLDNKLAVAFLTGHRPRPEQTKPPGARP